MPSMRAIFPACSRLRNMWLSSAEGLKRLKNGWQFRMVRPGFEEDCVQLQQAAGCRIRKSWHQRPQVVSILFHIVEHGMEETLTFIERHKRKLDPHPLNLREKESCPLEYFMFKSLNIELQKDTVNWRDESHSHIIKGA